MNALTHATMARQGLLFDFNMFEWIRVHGSEQDFEPATDESNPEFAPTNSLPGSSDRIEVYRKRVENGQPIFHSQDRKGYEDVEISPEHAHQIWVRATGLERNSNRTGARRTLNATDSSSSLVPNEDFPDDYDQYED